MAKINLKGREVPLLFTMMEMKAMQEEICKLDDLQYVLFGRNRDDEKDMSGYCSAEHLGALAKALRIMGNAGLEEAGEAPDLTDKKVMRSLNPRMIGEACTACMEAISEGMASEIPPKAAEGPVAVGLPEAEATKKAE
jgi:hypothetical protein